MIANADRRDEIKRSLSDPWRLAELLGLTDGAKRQASGLLCRCPAHNERSASCSITAAADGGIRVKCFACDFTGDALHLVAKVRGLDIAHDFPAVLETAAALAGLDPAPVKPRLASVHAPADLSGEWSALEPIGPDAWDYLRDRDLDDAATWCRACPTTGPLAAVAPGIAVALRDASGRVVCVQARNLSASHDFRVLGASSAGMFGQPQLVEQAQTVLVCEGLTDTLAGLIAFASAKNAAVVGFAGVQATQAIASLAWGGRRALIATDADGPGDDCAKALAEAIERKGGHAIRLRPEGGKDLAAMRSAGVDLLAFARTAATRAMGFRTFAERVEGERERRMADAGKQLSYGVAYLDAVTGGIVPRDVVLLGAESGLGKTELATIIAMTAATAGKRVHYFALEPEPDEVERRLKFKLLAKMLSPSGVHLSFQDWMQGKQDHLTQDIEEHADRVLGERYQRLHTFYRSARRAPFTADDFARMARALEDESDLLVLDHVHYFDEGEDANRGQKRNAMAFRDLAVQTGRPMIQIAHLRKKSTAPRKGGPRLVPERDDFEGSSHLFKPVKRAVLLAPAFREKRPVPWVWPTYLALVKNTYDSTRCRYVGLVGFNARQNSYEEGFVLGQLVSQGTKFEAVPGGELPYWSLQGCEQQEMPT